MSQSRKTKPVIFIAHTGDEAYLHALRRYVPDCEIIISDWSDKAGNPIAAKVMSDITRADIVVVVLTGRAAGSLWVNQEIGFALGIGKRVLPVFEGQALPGLLAGMEWEPYDQSSVDASALRAALRIGRWLKEDLTKVFTTYHDYRDWWTTVDERTFTSEKHYWATPHDTWSWVMAHSEQAFDIPYRTLIRGSTDFDKLTLETHYQGKEAVCGVAELSAYEEIAVLGALSVETTWDPTFLHELDTLLGSMQAVDTLFRWYETSSRRPTTIEVRMVLDDERAGRHRRRLDTLFERYVRGGPAPRSDEAAGRRP
jgi:hypothetical protein